MHRGDPRTARNGSWWLVGGVVTGSWPFKDRGDVVKQGGEVVLEGVRCAVWPLDSPRETSAGEVYDWNGEAEASAAEELVGKPNRSIVIGDRRLKVVGASRQELVPHVTLRLSEIRPGG